VSTFIERMEAEVRAVNPRATAFVRRLHTAHGPTREVMALFSAVLSGDAAIVNSFQRHRDVFCGVDLEELDTLIEEAHIRLAHAERQRINTLRAELEALAKLVVPNVHVTFSVGDKSSEDIEEVLTWEQPEA